MGHYSLMVTTHNGSLCSSPKTRALHMGCHVTNYPGGTLSWSVIEVHNVSIVIYCSI